MALAASLGGLDALTQLLSALPLDFPAVITVVQHLDPQSPSLMADILNRRPALTVKQAASREQLQIGTVYIAPRNKHLLVNRDRTLSLSDSAKANIVEAA